MQKSNFRPLNESLVSVLPKAMLDASWPLASRSDLQIAYDCGLYSWPYRLSRASGFCASRRSSARASMPPVPAVGSYRVRTMPGLGQVSVLLGEEQVDQQPDRVTRRVMVAGGLVRGLVELADHVLERVPHVGVGHDIGVQVDGAEGLYDLAQETGLLQGDDLLLEVEVLEHIHVRAEPVNVVDEVVLEPVRVLQKVGEGSSTSATRYLGRLVSSGSCRPPISARATTSPVERNESIS